MPETDYAEFAEYMAGTLVIDSSKRQFYPRSESDPYFQLTANNAACIAMIIPMMSDLVKQGLITWEEISEGMLMKKLNKMEVVQTLNGLKLPGEAREPRTFNTDGYETLPVDVYFSNKKGVLKSGLFSLSLSRVASLISPDGYRWVLNNASALDFQEIVMTERGASVTIKIGFLWSAKPSYENYVEFDGVDINQQLLPLQALVDYWNTQRQYYPGYVKLELVYGSHGMDPRNASLEAGRLALDEKVAFIIGDMNLELTTAVYTITNNLEMMQCSSTSDVAFLRGDPRDPSFITAQGSIMDPGKVASIILGNLQLSRTVVLYEETFECQSMVNAYQQGGVSVLAALTIPPIHHSDTSYHTSSIWKKHINQVRSLNARVLVHCGSHQSLYPLVDEAVKQGIFATHVFHYSWE
ncbi:hypothetical protein HK102_000276 [Quaeritorhiza haematococci]|nr:hypothetical protein HK102_000276 [Quaeritorhiza haematococci]